MKRIGFAAVEFAGYYGHSAAEVKRMLAGEGLICCGAHVPFELLDGEFDKTIEFHHVLGNHVVVVPSLPRKYEQTIDGWAAAGQVFQQLAIRLANQGLRLGYHNHAIEFKRAGDRVPFDVFFQNTSPEVFSELDLGGAGYGGANPIELIRRHRQRIRMIHAKDYTSSKPDVLIGDGDMDWKQLFVVAGGSVEWFVIEHDSNGDPDLADIKLSFERFQDLRAAPRAAIGGR